LARQPEERVVIVAAHQTMLAPQGAPLPYDAEVEYLESTGTQWVDSGYYADGYTAVDAVMRLNADINSKFVVLFFGPSRNAVPCYWGQYNYGGLPSPNSPLFFYCRQTSMRYTCWTPAAFSELVEWGAYHFSANSVTLNGRSLIYNNVPAERGALRVPSTLQIFGTATAGTVQIASMKIYDNGTLVRDFQPVRVGTVGYLYDRANPTGGPSGNGLYGSATSTPLVAGPDKNGG
jgi:hypothetical protein